MPFQVLKSTGYLSKNIVCVGETALEITIIDSLILTAKVPRLVRIGDAVRSFKKHMVKMLEDETSALRDNKPGFGGIMSEFVRALDMHEREVVAQPNLKESKDGKRGLSVDEIFGNIFVINSAGHNTTANTLAFSMAGRGAHSYASCQGHACGAMGLPCSIPST